MKKWLLTNTPLPRRLATNVISLNNPDSCMVYVTRVPNLVIRKKLSLKTVAQRCWILSLLLSNLGTEKSSKVLHLLWRGGRESPGLSVRSKWCRALQTTNQGTSTFSTYSVWPFYFVNNMLCEPTFKLTQICTCLKKFSVYVSIIRKV